MTGPIEMVILVFDEQDKAAETLQALNTLQKEDIIRVWNAAVIVKDNGGEMAFKETQDVDAKRGAIFGAIKAPDRHQVSLL